MTDRITISKSISDEVVLDYNSGMTEKCIIDKHIISVGTLYKILHQRGVTHKEYANSKRALSDISLSEQKEILSKYYKWRVLDILDYYDITKHTFYKMLSKCKVTHV